ncbi:related to HET-6OR heterokaryon incompatibility protein (het-6OR allele) [Fusarium torulosum]|uniref:Related to HET-6OR heterokaryon incompatibility protein (Het-6OR allele) n=1 Tax=Fusarium torulosum TaxID=33205 RepID=A0AAE8MIF0_9HYPO|nr:related to HET-6OR heterokaryon incompatibility protein (het-6OR allele) [Fusarium torulosum]
MSSSPAVMPTQAFDYSLAKLQTASTEIRLLDLYPSHPHQVEDESDKAADPTWDDPLVCRLYTTTIENPSPPYKALSYVWGDDRKTRSIWVINPPGAKPGKHGATMFTIPITESLNTVLRHLRRRRKTITLWIDQICINQADGEEKGQQVGQMGRIYSRAEQVPAWLGPAGDGSDALMDGCRDIGQRARDLGLESYLTRERYHLLEPIATNENPADEVTRNFQALFADTVDIFAPLLKKMVLRNWFGRPYFTRAWIVQELCLCTDTVFVCGTKAVSVELIMLAILMLQFAISNMHRSGFKALQRPDMPLERLQEIINEPTAALFSCRMIRQKHKGDQLHLLLRKLFVEHDTRASQHRDRVFALLGLASDADSLGIQPDYVSPESGTGRILTQAARAMIERSGRIDTLCYSQFPKAPGLTGLPSWVPDWRPNLRRSFYTINEKTDSHIFSASGPEIAVEAVNAPKDDLNILGLRGYLVDVIEKVARGDGWTDLSWDHTRYLGFFAQVDELWQLSMEKSYPIHGEMTRRRKEEARWRVPIGDVYWTVKGGSKRASADVAVYYDECLKNLHDFEEMNRPRPAEEGEWHGESSWQQRRQNGQLGQNYRDSMGVMKDKRPFLTQMGYLGMGPLEARPGDVVVIFCGGRIPFILHPLNLPEGSQGGEDSMFSFVGEAYCDGVMYGEIAGREKRTFFLV